MALLLLMAGAATSQINTDCSKGVVQSVLHAPVMVRSQRGGGAGARLGTASNRGAGSVWLWDWHCGASRRRVHKGPPLPWPHSRSLLPLTGPTSPSLPPAQGYVFGVVSALLSALGAVYTEWVLKKNNDTLYWQNTLLYGFGSLFNGINLYHRQALGVLCGCAEGPCFGKRC